MSDYLPVEVVLDILKSLPVKSVVKCMSVCKSWNSLIKTTSFISTHLQTSISKPHNQFLVVSNCVRSGKVMLSLYFDNDGFDESKQLHFLVPKNYYLVHYYFFVVGYCNGLVCCCLLLFDTYMFELTFWNPSIQKFITLPKPSMIRNGSLSFGFGFDSRTNDCKVFVVLDGKGKTSNEAYVFSLNENSWKRATTPFPECTMSTPFSLPFVNGAFHWMGYKREKNGRFSNLILGFDITTEQFSVFRLPEDLIGLGTLELSIIKYKESVGVLRNSVEMLEVWVMKKYGVVDSWTKVLYLDEQSRRMYRVLGFRTNGEVLMELCGGEYLASLDLNLQQMKPLDVRAGGFKYADSYVESLVLLDKGVDVGSVSITNHAKQRARKNIKRRKTGS